MVYRLPVSQGLAATKSGVKQTMLRGIIMGNVKADGTSVCAHEGCQCKVADDENHVKTAMGIFCCRGCSEGKGCDHPGCNCGSQKG